MSRYTQKATGRAHCRYCENLIKKGEKERVVSFEQWTRQGKWSVTHHFHPKCFEKVKNDYR